MTQTAVSWLMEKLKFIDKNAYGILYNESYEQAKEMEKEQITEAVMYGDIRGKLETYMTAEQYYNQNYNK
jgi:hypothetical protein